MFVVNFFVFGVIFVFFVVLWGFLGWVIFLVFCGIMVDLILESYNVLVLYEIFFIFAR